MDISDQPHRCPKCHALVVDRRSPACTTCHATLPADWIMTPQQVDKVMAIDKEIRAEHAASMKNLDPPTDPNASTVVKVLSTKWTTSV